MKYDTAIFDLDGTLLDTLEDLAAADNYALAQYGLPQLDLDTVRRYIGRGVRNLMMKSVYGLAFEERFGKDPVDAETFEAIFRCYRRYYSEHVNDRTHTYEGIPELVEKLRREGCRLAVLSNKYDQAVKDLMQAHFGDVFEVVLGQREGVPKKPDPAAVHEIMERLGAVPERTVYIGDSDVDVKTAKNAGTGSIICLWGFRGREELLEAGAEVLAEKPEDIWTFMQ